MSTESRAPKYFGTANIYCARQVLGSKPYATEEREVSGVVVSEDTASELGTGVPNPGDCGLEFWLQHDRETRCQVKESLERGRARARGWGPDICREEEGAQGCPGWLALEGTRRPHESVPHCPVLNLTLGVLYPA